VERIYIGSIAWDHATVNACCGVNRRVSDCKPTPRRIMV
jgi:hypothetical protein